MSRLLPATATGQEPSLLRGSSPSLQAATAFLSALRAPLDTSAAPQLELSAKALIQ